MLVAPTAVVLATTSVDLEPARMQAQGWRSAEMAVAERDLTDQALADLASTADQTGEHSFARAVSAVRAARDGDFAPVPHIDAGVEILRTFLQQGMIDGWLYVRESDGYLHPYLVTTIAMEHADRTRGARIKITTEADNPTVKRPSRAPRVLYFDETEVVGKTPAEDPETVRRILVENLRFAAAALEREEIRLLVEPLNLRDMPGFHLCGTGNAVALIEEVNHPNLWLQYDV